jgi:sulfur relay protein TusB/DsrH
MVKLLYFITDMTPTSIQFALEHQDSEVGICLLQDAVYFACKRKNGNKKLTEAIKRGLTIYVTKKDVELRGLKKLLHPKTKILDYNQIIDLVLKYKHIINM